MLALDPNSPLDFYLVTLHTSMYDLAMSTCPQIVLQSSSPSPGFETSLTHHNPAKKRDMKKKSRPGHNTAHEEDASNEDEDPPPSLSEALECLSFGA
jgi:hypothetical protein